LTEEEILKKYNIINNTSKKFFNGSEWDSNSCGKFIIIAKLNKYYTSKNNIKHYFYYLCKFEDGTIVEVERSAITSGFIKNPNSPVVHGVGYIGQGKWKSRLNGEITKEYGVWKRIMERCYSGYDRYLSYKNISVDEKWHCFQDFCEDLPYLKGYKNWKDDDNSKNEWEIDKDILCNELGIYPKIYSKSTCMFILKEDNELEMHNRTKDNYLTGLTYIATRLSDNYTQEFFNQSEFARKWGLQSSKIWRCLNSKNNKQHKGWAFKVKE
jgi:hypothetical protein